MADAIKKLRIVAFQEGGFWIAHCVEHDICVQGKDLAQARRRMTVALQQEAKYTTDRYGKAFQGIDPAPDYIEAMYDVTEEALDSEINFRIAA